MTQRIPDKVVEMLVNPTAPLAAQQAGIDLLSLRAAVRRVLEAEDEWRAADERFAKTLSDSAEYTDASANLRDARNALRAEMFGIDKDEGGKP